MRKITTQKGGPKTFQDENVVRHKRPRFDVVYWVRSRLDAPKPRSIFAGFKFR